MRHHILTTHPAFIEHLAKVERLEDARGRWQSRARLARADYEEAVIAHREAARLALLRGDQSPVEPVPPEATTDEARLFLEELKRQRDEERGLIAQLAEELEGKASERLAVILDEAAPLVHELESIAHEADDLIATVREARMHRERRREGIAPGGGLSDRMLQSVAPSDVVAAVIDGLQLLDPTPPFVASMRNERR